MPVLTPILTVPDFEARPYNISFSNTKSMPQDVLESEIVKRQDEFLLYILGYQEKYNLENDNAGAFPTTKKWIDFINGVSYVKDGYNIDYKGIREALKNYTYYWYLRDNTTQTNGFGGLAMQTKNADIVIQSDKMKNAWNEMVDLILKAPNYMQNTVIINRSQYPTIWNYLYDNDFDAEMDVEVFRKIQNIY